MKLSLLLFAFTLASLVIANAAEDRPNIVLIVADDLGHGDLSAYGCPDIKTPAIDSIGARGVRLTRYYNSSSTCTPTRTALMTGRYPQRVGGLENPIGLGNVGRYDEAEWLQKRGELGLPVEEPTLSQLLRAAGYATAVVGKWHLGYERKFWPDRHGFEESLVVLGGGVDYVTHQEPEPSLPPLHNGRPSPRTGYLTDVITDHALGWLAGRGADSRPYFLYLPFTAPHEPFQAPGDAAAPPDKWKDGTRDSYRRMVEHMDARIADILVAIARGPRPDNTIVIFISDNGAVGKGSNKPYRGYKASLWEGGIRGPCLFSWPAMIPAGTTSAQTALTMDLAATLFAAARVSLPPGHTLDGENLIASLRGKAAPHARTVYWRTRGGPAGGNKAVLDGTLKYLEQTGSPPALFDVVADPGEENNLLVAQPERAATLKAKLTAWEKVVAPPRLAAFYGGKKP